MKNTGCASRRRCLGGGLQPHGGVAAHGGHGEADGGPGGKASVEAFHAAGEDREHADPAKDVAESGAFHGLGFRCVEDVLRDNDTAGADIDLVLDVLHVMDHLSIGAGAPGLHVDTLRLAVGALGLRMALAEPAATVGLPGLGVDLFHISRC